MKIKPVRISDRLIGCGKPCFIVAEAGVNHNGKVEMALALIEAAAKAGVDAVKFQSFKADQLATTWAPKAAYQFQTTDASESQYEMLKGLELSSGSHRRIFQRCEELGVMCLSTPFDTGSADLLEELNVPAYKIPSGELTNFPLLRHIACKGRPVIMSTGMAHLKEVENAVRVLEENGNRDIVLLHCVSSYPAAPEDVNLRAMATLQETFGYNAGFSDHTLGLEVALAAVAMGATVLEKHFTLDRKLPGPDHLASLEPHELVSLVSGIRKVEAALGSGEKKPVKSEAATARAVRKSLVAACHIPSGKEITAEMLSTRRPGTGIPPSKIETLVGRSTTVDIDEGQVITEEMFQ